MTSSRLPGSQTSGSGPAVDPPAEDPVVKKTNRYDSAVSWGISLVIHVCLFLSFAGITWYSGLGPGFDETEVGIADEPAQAAIGMERSDLAPMPSRHDSAELNTLDQIDPAEQITELNITDVSTAPPTLDIDLASDNTNLGQDWDSFGLAAADTSGGGASFFGLAARGGNFVYVVDRSGSMTGSPLEAAKAELMRSISVMERQMKFFIFFYNNACLPMETNGLVRATAANRSRYFQWVQQIPGQGGTDPTEAMQQALALKPDAIWLLSDGLFPEKVCDAIRQANPDGRIQIHTIAFYNNTGERILRRIAEENRGKFRFVAPPSGFRPR